MPRSDAMDRAIKKYEQEKVDRILFRVPKGMKEKIQNHAEKKGESLSAFLNRAILETIDRDTKSEK
jgi:predicted HicB family RNase H-like nuclease